MLQTGKKSNASTAFSCQVHLRRKISLQHENLRKNRHHREILKLYCRIPCVICSDARLCDSLQRVQQALLHHPAALHHSALHHFPGYLTKYEKNLTHSCHILCHQWNGMSCVEFRFARAKLSSTRWRIFLLLLWVMLQVTLRVACVFMNGAWWWVSRKQMSVFGSLDIGRKNFFKKI